MKYRRSLIILFVLLATIILIRCKGSPTNSVSDWIVYQNEVLGYSFNYHSDCTFGPMPLNCKQVPPEERPPECLCFLDTSNPNEVFMQAFHGDVNAGLSLTSFTVAHYETPAFNPPEGQDLISWLNTEFGNLPGEVPSEPNMTLGGLPAARVNIPGSPQSLPYEEIYVIKGDKLIKISMLDVDIEVHQEYYGKILASFQFSE